VPTNRIIPKLIEPIDDRICSKLLIDAIEQVLESRKNRPMCPIRGSCFLNYITNFTIGILIHGYASGVVELIECVCCEKCSNVPSIVTGSELIRM
jgi:hypothetical protein